MNSNTWTIESLPLATTQVPGPEVFWMQDWDRWYDLTIQVFLLTSPAGVVLINTGPGLLASMIDQVWSADLGPRGRLIVIGDLKDQLNARGIATSDIDEVIVTPLQPYTLGGLTGLQPPRVVVSGRGWRHHLDGPHTMHDAPEWDVPRAAAGLLLEDNARRLVLADDECVLRPGLSASWIGTHHRSSLLIEVTTLVGRVAITDAVFLQENLRRRRPIGICENLDEAERAFDLLADFDLVLPIYDPAVAGIQVPGPDLTGAFAQELSIRQDLKGER